MIRSVVLLARTSPMSVLLLAASLLALISVVSDPPEQPAEPGPALAAALAPTPNRHAPGSDGAAALRVALFDPERRPETVSGSIDDLRGAAPPAPEPVTVVISGVLLDGHKARAMLSVVGGPASWSGVGAEVGGWRVASIDAGGAVLEHDGRSLALRVADRWKSRGHAHPDGAAAASPAPAEEPQAAPGGNDFGTPDPLAPPKP